MGKIGALTDVVKSGLTKADEFLDYLGNKIGNLNIPEFSPSLKAAENLPQEIGNYKDLKAWMIKKGGAKGGELEWSGADEFFAGKKVTKDELVRYLKSNTNFIKEDTNVAKGKMSSATFLDQLDYDVEEKAIADYVERELANLKGKDDINYIRDDLYEEIEGMRYWVNKQDEFHSKIYPDGKIPSEIVDSVESDALTYTDENFPLGGTNTSETVYRYEDPTGKLKDYIEDAHLFDGLPGEDIIAHTRTAEFPVVDGGNAYHVGELQSDIAQMSRNKNTRSRAEEIDWQEYGGSIESSQYSGAPFVESTNQWVDMLLKKELKKAIESGSEFMTIPSSKLVRKYTHGSAEGQGKFYDSIVPMRLQKLAKKYDPDAKIVQKKIKTEVSDENVKALPLTQILINNVLKKGLPKYAMPITAIGGYGALSELKEEPQ